MADQVETECKYPMWIEARMAAHRKKYGRVPEPGDSPAISTEYELGYGTGYRAGVLAGLKASE
jgi:hypothetical protein